MKCMTTLRQSIITLFLKEPDRFLIFHDLHAALPGLGVTIYDEIQAMKADGLVEVRTGRADRRMAFGYRLTRPPT